MGEREDLCGRTVGEFVLRECIDEGGFGAVYRCEQPLLGREAVVKVLHQRLRRNDVVLQRFMREAQLASRLDHPYAAHVYAFGIEHDDGLFWIAMEMVQGTALNRWLRERGPLPLDQFVPFFERVAEVVQTAHDRGIVHRDLKPSNVMVIERAGRLLPKLLDFGVAKLLDDSLVPTPPPVPRAQGTLTGDETPQIGRTRRRIKASEATTLTGTTAPPARQSLQQGLTDADATVGSPPYMSPEQWSNAMTVGTASDLYALGVVAYEALSGRRPFNASTVAEYVDLHCNAPVPPLGDGFPAALDRCFQRALAKRPADRWGSALELASALRVSSGLGMGAPDLPRLDEALRDAWLADAPQPLAESIAALDGARNAHQARDAAQELVGNLLRYLLALALATRAQVHDDRGDPALLELVRAMRRRDLRVDERVRLLRLLVRAFTGQRGAHPIPELVELATPGADDGADGLDALLSVHATSDSAAAEDIVRVQLARLIPELADLLRKTAFVLDYVLVVPRNDAAERWTGLRRQHRAPVTVRAGELVKHHPMLLDRESQIRVDLWPLVQVVSPTEGAEPELFLFDGPGRHGARLLAAPAGFAHHDPSVWEWLAAWVIADVDGHAEVADGDRPPYLGLTPYATSDAARFVGREQEVDAFLNRLRQRSMLVIVGPSGAGKSSFVHAGVVPGLPASWRTIAVRPGAAPLGALASRLAAANITSDDLRAQLERSPAEVAALVARSAAGGTIVVVIDQLEELFTLCASAAERLQFAAVIAQLAASAEAPVRVICVVRDDFLMQLDALAPLRPLLSPALVLLGNPSRDALVRILVEPARRVGYTLSDPRLAPDMVDAVVDRPGALALLSFAAFRLWELRDRRFCQLTRTAYDAMGGIGGALGRHAEATLERFSVDEQVHVRQTFRHLVTADGTRALLTLDELRQRLATPSADAVIDKLVDARLIATSEIEGASHVEVIHDALLHAWPRLQQWVREDIDGARMRDQIRTSARQWHARERSNGLLWRDDVLADLERWLRRSMPVSLSELESAFVEASRRYGRRATRIRRTLAGAAIAFALLFAVFQYRALQSRAAQGIAEAHVTQSLVDQGRISLIAGKHSEALVYLAEAFRRGDRSPSMQFMLSRATQPFLAEHARLPSTAGVTWSVAFSADGRWLVTADDRGARVWNAQTHELRFALLHDAVVFGASFTPDGKRIVTAGSEGLVKLWDTATGTLQRVLPKRSRSGLRPTYVETRVSPDGRLIAAIDAVSAVTEVWEADTGALLAQLETTEEVTSTSTAYDGSNAAKAGPSLAFSQDGAWLATSDGGDVQVFDTRTWRRVRGIQGPQINWVTFDPTGPRLATASWKGDVSIWSIPSGERLHHLHQSGERLDHVTYSPDGAFVVAVGRDGAERIWSARTGSLQAELRSHHDPLLWSEFDPTSKLVVSADRGGVVTISDVMTGTPLSTLEGPVGTISMVRFDPASRRVVGPAWNGAAWIWDTAPLYRRWITPPIHQDCGTDASLDGDRRFVAISCVRHGTYVWDTARDQLLAELPSATAGVFPAVSDAGDRVALTSGSAVLIYALPGGRLDRTIQHPAPVTSVAFARAGHDLISGGDDGSLLLTRENRDGVPLTALPEGVSVVGFTPDRRVIAAGHGVLRVYDPGSNTILADRALPITVRSIRVSSDGRQLITTPGNGAPDPPVLWDLEHYRIVAKLEGHIGRVFGVHFIDHDRGILTSGSDGDVRRWDATTGRLQKMYLAGPFVLDATVTPDGSTVVTGGGDGVLRFWDGATGRMMWTLRAHRSQISGLHFEGNDLVSRSFVGEIARWTLPTLTSSQNLGDVVESVVRCLPLRFDENSGGLVTQPTPCNNSSPAGK